MKPFAPPTIFLALLLCAAASAEARTEQSIALKPDTQASIKVGSCFDNLALTGYAPIDVTINNHSGKTQQWVLEFTSPAYSYGSMNSIQSTFTVAVENNGTRTFPLLVPMTESVNGQGPAQVRVSGYGAEESVEQMIGARSWSGKTPTAYVAMSESLWTSRWSDLSKRLELDGKDLVGSTVNPDDLPEDWRGLSGVAALWLSSYELDHLDAAQRDAIRTWVHTGGRLMLCGAAQVPQDLRFAGFGQVNLLPATPDLNETMATIKENLPPHERGFDAFGTPQRKRLAEVKPNVLLLSGFIGLFAIVVGPLNIFGLARRRRERLFWTTPLISLCASGLLIGMIMAQDGSGGHGVRSAVVCLFPQSRNAVVIQEQLSRTGLLLDSAFQTRDPACIEELEIDLHKASAYGTTAKGRELRNAGTSYSKEWFASRSAQAQRIVAVTPTRAEITLLNAAGVATGEAPVIVSSFATTLDTFFYTGPDHRLWQGKEVRTGQKQALQLIDPVSALAHPPYIPDELPRSLAIQPGSFWATATQGTDYVATLGSIHWADEPVTYVGPVTSTP